MNERRTAARRPAQFPVLLTVDASVELTGTTLNLSRSGLLLEAHGKMPVTLIVNGVRYKGVLVRAGQHSDGSGMTYAIQLIDSLDL